MSNNSAVAQNGNGCLIHRRQRRHRPERRQCHRHRQQRRGQHRSGANSTGQTVNNAGNGNAYSQGGDAMTNNGNGAQSKSGQAISIQNNAVTQWQ